MKIEEDSWLDNYLKFGFWQLLVMSILLFLSYFIVSFITNEWTETYNDYVHFFTTYSIEQRLLYLAAIVAFGMGGLFRHKGDEWFD